MGTYSHGNIIVQTKEACAPCPHSTGCPYDNHPCSSKITPECISMIATQLFAGASDLKVIAREFSDLVDIRMTAFNLNGNWYSYSIGEVFGDRDFSEIIEQSMWHLLLSRNSGDRITPYGSEVASIIDLLDRVKGTQSPAQFNLQAKRLAKKLSEFKSNFDDFRLEINESIQNSHGNDYSSVEQIAQEFTNQYRGSKYFSVYSKVLDSFPKLQPDNFFLSRRRAQDTLNRVEEMSEIQIKLLNTLDSNLMEVI